MATMNVSLPDPMKAWVEEQTTGGRYGNASDYIRDLIRRDQDRLRAIAELQGLVDEGIASGESPRGPDDIVAEARRRARREP
jgi:antitoxin ParD1/3/4